MDWIDEIEAQADETSPYYLPRLLAEIRRLRESNALLQRTLTMVSAEFNRAERERERAS